MGLRDYLAICSAVLGLGLMLTSKLHFGIHAWKWKQFLVGTLFLAVPVVLVVRIANSPPISDPTDIDERLPPVVIESPLEKTLQSPWDAYAYPNWPVASELAECASRAYLAPVVAENELKSSGYEQVRVVNDGSMLGYVATVGDVAVIMFRGTNPSEIQDWFANLNNAMSPSAHGPVHSGFLGSYDALHGQVTIALRKRKLSHVWITGHSLGGALAACCAYRLMTEEGINVDGLVTFGQPRVGSAEFAKFMDGQLLGRAVHFVNEADVVPRVPPRLEHFGSLVWYTQGTIRRSRPPLMMAGSDGNSYSNDEYTALPALTEREFAEEKLKAMSEPPVQLGPNGEPLMQGNSPYIKDHSMALYIERLRGKLMEAMASPTASP